VNPELYLTFQNQGEKLSNQKAETRKAHHTINSLVENSVQSNAI